MTEADRATFAAAMTAMCATFSREADEALLEGYWMGCHGMELQTFQHAAQRALQEAEHLPRPADLWRLSGALSGSERAALAWAAVYRAIDDVGGRSNVTFDEPLIHAAVRRLGGWAHLCSLPDKELRNWTKRDFIQLYEALMVCPPAEPDCRPLVGSAELENASLGYDFPPTVHQISTGIPQRPQLRLVGAVRCRT